MLFGTPCRPRATALLKNTEPRVRKTKQPGRDGGVLVVHSICLHSGLQAPAARGMGTWAALFAELCWGRHHSSWSGSEVRARIQGEEEWTTEQPFVTARELRTKSHPRWLVRSICRCTHGMLCGKKCWRTRTNILTAPLHLCIGQWTQGRSSTSA
jgi:hypothetical protein